MSFKVKKNTTVDGLKPFWHFLLNFWKKLCFPGKKKLVGLFWMWQAKSFSNQPTNQSTNQPSNQPFFRRLFLWLFHRWRHGGFPVSSDIGNVLGWLPAVPPIQQWPVAFNRFNEKWSIFSNNLMLIGPLYLYPVSVTATRMHKEKSFFLFLVMCELKSQC